MSLLTIAQDIANDVGIEGPTSIINNEDDDAKRLLRHITATGIMLMREYPWQTLRREASFTSVATEDQGAISTLVTDDDVDRILPDTVYNRSTQREQFGQTQADSYAFDKARAVGRVYDKFYIRGGRILINPVPAGGNVLTFEYVSNKWIYNGSTRKAAFTADTDNVYLDPELLTMGAVARVKKSIGADFQGDEVQFMRELEKRKAADTPQGTVFMSEAGEGAEFGFYVERTA